jgi:hypothetical protein
MELIHRQERLRLEGRLLLPKGEVESPEIVLGLEQKQVPPAALAPIVQAAMEREKEEDER